MMNEIKRFFKDFPRNVKQGEKGAVIFTGLLALLVIGCLFAAILIVPKLFSSQAANADGGEVSVASTTDPDWWYDYTMIESTSEEETEVPSEETTEETEVEIPSNLSQALKKPVKYEEGKKNDPEDGQKPPQNVAPPVVAPPPVVGSVDPIVPLNPNANYNYYVSQALSGFQKFGGVKYNIDNGNIRSSGFHKIDELRYRINDYGAVSSKMGVDVSEFNGTVDWQVAKNYGIDFAMLRIGYRGWGTGKMVLDGMFKTNASSAMQHNMPIGVYFFSQAINAAEGVEEAVFVIQRLNEFREKDGITIKYPIYIDSEKSTAPAGKVGRADNISKASRTAAVKAFCDTIRNAGYKAGIYASASWFTERLNYSQISNNEIWVANWNVSKPNFGGSWKMWQYSGDGNDGSPTISIPGIQSGTDLEPIDVNMSVYDYAGGSDMSTLGVNNILLKTRAEADVYMDAENWVAKAEASRSAEDYEIALAKVNVLFDARAKNPLLAWLNSIDITA